MELKPCPFCGSEVIYLTHTRYYDPEDTVCVFCNTCKSVVVLEENETEGINARTREAAVAAWNTRAELTCAAAPGSDEPPYDDLLRCLENDWHISASWDGLRKFWCIELTEEGVRIRDAAPMAATDVMHAIGQLRRDLNGYHDQLMAHSDLQRHCDNQRERIAELEGLYAGAKAEAAELKEQTRWMAQTKSRWEAAVRDLEQTKAEIVRCRDCRSYRASDATCHAWQWSNWDEAVEVDPDGFCSWGERRGA